MSIWLVKGTQRDGEKIIQTRICLVTADVYNDVLSNAYVCFRKFGMNERNTYIEACEIDVGSIQLKKEEL